jgi:hypothetical protein
LAASTSEGQWHLSGIHWQTITYGLLSKGRVLVTVIGSRGPAATLFVGQQQ